MRSTRSTLRDSPIRVRGLFIAGTCIAIALFAADIAFGSVTIPLTDLLAILTGGAPSDSAMADIIMLFRMPKALTAALAGMALATSGLLLQTIFRNPLAGPDLLGINSGASIGVAFLILLAGGGASSSLLGSLGLAGQAAMAVAASLGAGLVLVIIALISRRFENGVTLLIMGMLVGYVTGSAVSLMVYFGAPQKIQLYLAWTYGSFSSVTLDAIPVLAAAVAIGLALAIPLAKPLDALILGDRAASSIGTDPRKIRRWAILASSLLAGTVTAFCGPIAFLGIASPLAAKALFRNSSHKVLLGASALTGAIFALAADIVTQAPRDGAVLPINPLLAVIGAPFIFAVFLRKNRPEGLDP